MAETEAQGLSEVVFNPTVGNLVVRRALAKTLWDVIRKNDVKVEALRPEELWQLLIC